MKQQYIFGENKIFVEQSNPENKTYDNPIILVHGSFGGYFMWNHVVSGLVSGGFECFTLSLRSHKPSGGPDLSEVGMQDYVDDVALVIRELGLDSPIVIGHSMGGLVALMYSANNPVRAAVLIGPSAPQEVRGSKTAEEVKNIPLVYNIIDAGMPIDPAEVMKALPDIPPQMLMKMKEILGPESGKARRERKIGISVPRESLEAPMLVVASNLESSLPFGVPLELSKKTAEYYNADFIEVEGASHPGIIMGSRAPEVAEKIGGWLREL